MSGRNARGFNSWLRRQPDWVIYVIAAAVALAILRGCLEM